MLYFSIEKRGITAIFKNDGEVGYRNNCKVYECKFLHLKLWTHGKLMEKDGNRHLIAYIHQSPKTPYLWDIALEQLRLSDGCENIQIYASRRLYSLLLVRVLTIQTKLSPHKQGNQSIMKMRNSLQTCLILLLILP